MDCLSTLESAIIAEILWLAFVWLFLEEVVEVLALPNDDSVDVTEGIWKLGFGLGVTLIPCLLGV